MAEYFCSWSGGADSTATALLALEHGEPLTALVYCEVMFDEHTSGEVPEHAEFIHGTAIPWFEAHGVPVEVLRSEKNIHGRILAPDQNWKAGWKVSRIPVAGILQGARPL